MGKRKKFIGTVISDKMQKTIIVRIPRLSKDPQYGRIVKKTNKFKVHDENKVAKVGDMVSIEETRPLSKDKRFRLMEVVQKAKVPQIEIKEDV